MHVRSAAVALVTALLAAAAPAAPALAADVAFDAAPAAGSATDPGGGWFTLSLAPGGRADQAVAVRNTSAEPLQLQVDAVDATTMAAGGASYAAPGTPAAGTGTWVGVADPDLVLAPGEARTVPFTVRVPLDARPGDHLAGLSLAAPATAGRTSTTANGASTSIDLRTRRVIAVHVQVPGPAEPRVEIGGVAAAVRPPGPQLEVTLRNTGGRLVRGRGVLTLPDDGVRHEFDLDTFVPGTSIAYPLPWPDDAVAGSHRVRVELLHDGRTVTWDGDVAVTADAVEAAASRGDAPGATTAAAPPASGVSPTTLVLAVLGGVGLALGGQALVRTSRRRAGKG